MLMTGARDDGDGGGGARDTWPSPNRSRSQQDTNIRTDVRTSRSNTVTSRRADVHRRCSCEKLTKPQFCSAPLIFLCFHLGVGTTARADPDGLFGKEVSKPAIFSPLIFFPVVGYYTCLRGNFPVSPLWNQTWKAEEFHNGVGTLNAGNHFFNSLSFQ